LSTVTRNTLTRMSDWSKDQIKQTAGFSGAIISNMTGIPTDRFRVLVAQDTKNTYGVFSHHFKEMFKSPTAAFNGGLARIGMKQMATTLNLYVPQEFREESPFIAAFLVGLCFSPILNIPRVFQLGKISGVSYPQSAKDYFGSAQGLKQYASNTAIFGPGEGLRMMMCFGCKDFLMPKIGGKTDVNTISSIPSYAGSMALVAGPIVAAVETTFALTTETISTIQAKLASSKGAGETKAFGDVLKETITPKYMGRCWVSLCIKNIAANTPLFWIMFMADFYSRKATH